VVVEVLDQEEQTPLNALELVRNRRLVQWPSAKGEDLVPGIIDDLNRTHGPVVVLDAIGAMTTRVTWPRDLIDVVEAQALR
jgi:hypothetical protein